MIATLFIFDVLLTALHTYQEYRGELWGYFGRIAGVRIPRPLGVALFSTALPLGLWALAVLGIGAEFFGATELPWAVGALAGARCGDAVFSHAGPRSRGHRPNPGFSTASVGMVEALAIPLVWNDEAPGYAVGFFVGAGLFALVLPSLRLLRRLLPERYRQDPWVAKS